MSGELCSKAHHASKSHHKNSAKKTDINPNQALSAIQVLARVNDDVITSYDVDMGKRFYDLVTQTIVSKEQVLKTLIRQRLQLQAATGKNKIPSAAEIEASFISFAKDNKMTHDEMIKNLKSHNITKEFVIKQIKTDLSWKRYIQDLGQNVIYISDQDIDQRLQDLRDQKDHKAFEVFQIFMKAKDKGNDTKKRLQKIRDDISKGAPFQVMAQQFSDDFSSTQGGYMGWIMPDSLPENVMKLLDSMHVGTISEIIETNEGCYIYYLKSKRNPGEGDPNHDQLSYCQVSVPLKDGIPQEKADGLIKIANTLAESKSCESMQKLALKTKIDFQKHDLITLGGIPDDLRRLLMSSLKDDQAKAVQVPEGFIFFKTSDYKKVPFTLPNRNDIEKILEGEQLNFYANKEFNKIYNAAYIDLKKNDGKEVLADDIASDIKEFVKPKPIENSAQPIDKLADQVSQPNDNGVDLTVPA
jgi:peptidyl-prolyl cis-trans isomerase SurA